MTDHLSFVKGWATDLKTVSKDMIDRRSARTGDGSRKSLDGVYDNNNGAENDSGLWGWGKTDHF